MVEAQAVGAGDVLAAHGICFDRGFVSNLKRTVKTAWLVLERHVQKLDCEPDHRLQDLDANTLALQDYLSAKPDIYELTALDAPATGWGLLGAFVADAPPAAYAASFAEIVID